MNKDKKKKAKVPSLTSKTKAKEKVEKKPKKETPKKELRKPRKTKKPLPSRTSKTKAKEKVEKKPKKETPKKELKKPSKTPKSPPLETQLLNVTQAFLSDLECIEEMFEVVIPALKDKDEERHKEIVEVVNELKLLTPEGKKVRIETNAVEKVIKLGRKARKVRRADKMFRCQAVVLLISRFDEFMADVIKVYLKAHPDQLRSSNKTLTIDEILDLESVDKVFDVVIDREIDTVMRQSHLEQIEFIDDRLKLGLKEHFAHLRRFVEICERRNLIVHAGGVVNKRYLKVCKAERIKLDKLIVEGKSIAVTDDYFKEACTCLFELALRIGQSAARRIFPDHLTEADFHLHEIGFPILQAEEWNRAKVVYDYAMNIPLKFVSNDLSARVFVINLCICLKHLGKKKEMIKLLSKYDWSASDAKLRLGENILREDFDQAEKLMSTMTKDDPFDEEAYRKWPIFLDFRKTENFERAFKKIFKKDYQPEISAEESQAYLDSEEESDVLPDE